MKKTIIIPSVKSIIGSSKKDAKDKRDRLITPDIMPVDLTKISGGRYVPKENQCRIDDANTLMEGKHKSGRRLDL